MFAILIPRLPKRTAIEGTSKTMVKIPLPEGPNVRATKMLEIVVIIRVMARVLKMVKLSLEKEELSTYLPL